MRYGIYQTDQPLRQDEVYENALERAKETILFLLKVIGKRRCQCACVVCERLLIVDVDYAPEKEGPKSIVDSPVPESVQTTRSDGSTRTSVTLRDHRAASIARK